MAQEFTINSTAIESKINSLLPSQGGAGAGVDFSASTMIVPIIDLTEAASGAGLRQDLQRSISHTTTTVFDVSNTTSTVLSTTGYYFFKLCVGLRVNNSIEGVAQVILNDGTTNKVIYEVNAGSMGSTTTLSPINAELNVFLAAGDSVKLSTNSVNIQIVGIYRQIASIDGVLVNPS
jgi:hypothetical protein|tara:strand:- start:65 stop:595 length:531 start_codon:yes stop_codon:yes gene_type:complete